MAEISDDDADRCRDDLMLKLAKLKPMTNAELQAKQRVEKAARDAKKKERGPKPAPK